jgi:iron complex transport system permease protein
MIADKVETKYSKRASKWKLILLLLIIALVAVIFVCLNIGFTVPGQQPITFQEVFNIIGKQIPILNSYIDTSTVLPSHEAVIMAVRLPRILGAALVGAGLAAAGVLYQGIFKNPMADSYLLGASAGASLSYTVAALYAGSLLTVSLVGIGFSQVFAFLGAIVTVFVVFLMSRVGNKVPVTTLLLSGLVVNVFLLAIQSVFVIQANKTGELGGILSFMFGNLSHINWQEVFVVFPLLSVGILLAYFYTKDLNMLTMGDETAQHLGVNTERVRKILLALSSLITGAVVSISGVIGFVGLVIPHMTRLVIGPDHRILLPTAAVIGAIFLILCDAIARIATGQAAELQVGVITAIIGTPLFIYLLRRRKTTYSL